MNNRVLMTLAFAAISAVGFAAEVKTPGKALTANRTNLLEITGMTCNACAKGLTSELHRLPGVVSASISFSNKVATVAIDTNQLSQTTLLTAIKEAGFGAKPKP